MKKYSLLYMGLAAIIGLGSCKKYLDDVAENPNKPLTAPPHVLLPSIEVATFSNYTGGAARRSEILIQHMTGTDFQSRDVTNYAFGEGDVNNEWRGLYAGAVVNIKILVDQYGEKNPYYRGIALVLRAMNLGLATDLWGDVPNKEAGMGFENLSPKYDRQEAILADIQTMLSSAIADLSKPVSANLFLPGADDYIYAGNTKKWIAAAWALKARYANRLNKWDPTNSANNAISYLNSAYTAGFDSLSTLNAMFGETGQDQNQWQAFNQGRRNYIKMGKFFIDLLKANNDPRLEYYADTVNGAIYVGAAPTNPVAAGASDMGDYLEFNEQLPLLSYAEAKFIEAECKLRAGDNTGAASAHNRAVKASLKNVTGTSQPAYEALYANETSVTITLDKIMTQKYIALFGQVESYTDWRRTNIPGLSPNPNGAVASIPRSLPTSQEERLYNSNATVNTNILNRVWWDK